VKIIKTNSMQKRKNLILENTKIRNLVRKYPIFLILIVLLIVGHLSDPMFITLRNQKNIMLNFSVPFILSIGQTMVILTGGIDLSIGSVVSLTGVTLAFILPKTGILLGVIIVLLMGGAIGALNGYIISRFKILPFLVTLSSMIVYEGLAFIVTGSVPVPITIPAFYKIDYGSIFGVIPLPVIYSSITFILSVIFLNYHVIGRRVYQLGNDEETAKLAGIKINRLKIGIYMLNGFIAAFCGIIVASRIKLGAPTAGKNFLFDSIAAVCLGGTSLMGGQGGVIGTLGGMLLMVNLKNILILNDVSIYIQDAIRGVIILISVIALSKAR
jgi:ribose/xylose/arabinose/galactoside ABC-type transport system permease subunit